MKKNGLNHGIAPLNEDGNNNNNINNKSLNEKATQAYKLFSEGKTLIQVSIKLGLRQKEASRFFMEFLKLKRQYRLYQIYPQIEHCLASFLKMHKVLKRRGMNLDNVEQFIDAIETGAVKLPEVQNQYQSLKNKVQMEMKKLVINNTQKQKAEKDLQDINNQIKESSEIEAMYSSNCKTLLNEIDRLYDEKCQLEQFVFRFRNGNRKYLKIRSIAKEQVNRLLTEQEPTFRLGS